MKKEVRLIFKMDNENDRFIYENIMNKSVATAYVKDVLIEKLKGDLVSRKEIDTIIESIKIALKMTDDFTGNELNSIEVKITNNEIEEVNDFDD